MKLLYFFVLIAIFNNAFSFELSISTGGVRETVNEALLKKIKTTNVKVFRKKASVKKCKKISEITPRAKREIWEKPLDSCERIVKRAKKIAHIQKGDTVLVNVGIKGCPEGIKITVFDCDLQLD
ncbi:MAG: hypothetical protein N4A33_10175 [Bacteriovoracaceae bacterium]|jgi:hypothetical protein|nr:hypothetical protein [Bacteriovoracaceae bacterium]